MPTNYFLTPPDIPEGLTCRTLTMPSSLEWLGIFNSLLGYLTEEWRYIQENETDLTPAETVAKMKDIINAYYSASECGVPTQPGGAPFIGYDDTGRFQQLYDSGWGEPSGDYTVPPIPPRESGTDEDKRCLAAANATNVLKVLYEQLSDDYAESLTTAEAISNLVTVIALLIGAWLGLAIAAVIAIYRIMFQVVYETIEFVTADLWTEEFDEDVQCAFYLCSSVDVEGVVTFDMECIVKELAERTQLFPNPITALLFGQVQAILNIIGTDGLNAAGATTAITSADCTVCGCPPVQVISPWSNFETATTGYDDCSIAAPTCVWRGSYVGYVSPIGYTTEFDITIDLGEVRTVASVDYAGAFTGIANALFVMLDDGTTLLGQDNPPAGYATGGTVTVTVPNSTRYVRLIGRATDTAPSERHLWLVQATIYLSC